MPKFGIVLKGFTMKNKIDLRDKIFNGIKQSIEKMIEDRAKNNDSIVVSKDGKIIRIPAREILRNN